MCFYVMHTFILLAVMCFFIISLVKELPMQYSAGINLKVSQQQRSKAEIALPIESHRRPFERQ